MATLIELPYYLQYCKTYRHTILLLRRNKKKTQPRGETPPRLCSKKALCFEPGTGRSSTTCGVQSSDRSTVRSLASFKKMNASFSVIDAACVRFAFLDGREGFNSWFYSIQSCRKNSPMVLLLNLHA